jgi:pilus assembly protein CpaE
MMAAVVSPSPDVRDRIADALAAHAGMHRLWTTATYPGTAAFEELNREPDNCVLFLDFRERDPALRIARAIDRDSPRVAVVAVNAGTTVNDLAPLMQAGVREVLPAAFTAAEITAATERVSAGFGVERSRAHGDICMFVPAKPGSGATTLATCTALAAARLSDTPVLLIDLDLTLGITSFLLKQSGSHSVSDALMHSEHLDEDLWANLICERGNLHVLGSAPTGFTRRYSGASCRRVLDFARERYTTVLVDVGGTFDEQETAAAEMASEIFLVTTPDMGGLHLGRRKSDHYAGLGLTRNLRVLLNRVDRKRALALQDIEKILQAPVAFSVNSDEDVIAAAVAAGGEIDWRGTLGKQIEAIAGKITKAPKVEAPPRRIRRFVEYFSMSSARAEVECR